MLSVLLRYADLTLRIFSEHFGIVVELHAYISMYVCVCVYMLCGYFHAQLCLSFSLYCRLSQRIHMRGLEAQRQVEALSGDWAHY